MKMMKRMLALLMMLAVVFTMTACKKEEPATVQTNLSDTTVPNASDVMLSVGGTALNRATYETYLKSLEDYYTSYGYDVTDPELSQMLKQFALQTGVEYIVMDLKLVELTRKPMRLLVPAAQKTDPDSSALWRGIQILKQQNEGRELE